VGIVIITVPHNKESSAKIEILDCILPRDYEAEFLESGYRGLLILKSKINSDEIVDILKECPTAYVYRVIPVDVIVESNISSILKAIIELIKGRTGRIKIECHRRGKVISSAHELKVIIGEKLKALGYKIDFRNPDFLLFINVIGEKTAITFGSPNRIIKKLSLNSLGNI
jgi:tRNA acetyltransferase TAN1